MSDEDLARRFATYSDAIVAFATVNLLAFLSTLADPVVRCTLAHIPGAAIAVNLALGVVNILGLAACGRARRRLERNLPTASATAQICERQLSRARYAIVAAAALAAAASVYAASFDGSCQLP